MATHITQWGKWTCTQCGRNPISGKWKRCPGCGNPREQHELDKIRPPDNWNEPTLSIDELKMANDGPDWFCVFCKTGNQGSHINCCSCGASREDAEAVGSVGIIGQEKPGKMPARPTGGTGHPRR